MKAQPVLRWAGGKRQLVDRLMKHVPSSLKGATYYEPFFGAGALFFELVHREHFYDAVISDVNVELIEVYTVIRDSVDELIAQLKMHKERHNKKHFYATRNVEPFTLGTMLPSQRAARMIYLNRTGFNGLHRQNKRGQNNVPMGDQKNPTICNEKNLRAVAGALRYQIKILAGDFRHAVEVIGPGDVCYFDPPYIPLEANNFHQYTKDGFSLKDHERLADIATELVRRGVTVIVSNSYAKPVWDLYLDPFVIHEVEATRLINRDATKRGPVKEVIIVGVPS